MKKTNKKVITSKSSCFTTACFAGQKSIGQQTARDLVFWHFWGELGHFCPVYARSMKTHEVKTNFLVFPTQAGRPSSIKFCDFLFSLHLYLVQQKKCKAQSLPAALKCLLYIITRLLGAAPKQLIIYYIALSQFKRKVCVFSVCLVFEITTKSQLNLYCGKAGVR